MCEKMNRDDGLRVLVGLLTMLCSVNWCGAFDPKLADVVLGRHKATAESIHSFYCRFSGGITNANGKNEYPSGEFWRVPFASRVRMNQIGKPPIDYLIKGGKGMSLFESMTPEGRAYRAGAIVHDDRKADPRTDVWSHAGLTFTSQRPPHPNIPLEEFLGESGNQIMNVEYAHENGRKMIYIVVNAGKTSEISIWFDPVADYLVDRVRYRSRAHKHNNILVQLQVKQRIKDSVVAFPTHVEVLHGDEKTPTATETFRFADVRINAPLPAEIFEMKYGPGTVVDDMIAGERYLVGAKGEAINREALPGSPPPTAATPEKPSQRPPTENEPETWTYWLLPMSLATLLGAVILRIVQSRRVELKK